MQAPGSVAASLAWQLRQPNKLNSNATTKINALCSLQWIPPHERAKAVSLSTSGMYLGSAAGMLVLPSIAARAGPGALLKVVGGLGYAWLALWMLVGQEVPHRYQKLLSMLNTDDMNGHQKAGSEAFEGSKEGCCAVCGWLHVEPMYAFGLVLVRESPSIQNAAAVCSAAIFKEHGS